jgi:predicted metal-dependent RNase
VKKEIKATVAYHPFSGHADGLELRQAVRLNPETIILMHGEYNSVNSLKEGLINDYVSFGKKAPSIRYLIAGDSVMLKKPQ